MSRPIDIANRIRGSEWEEIIASDMTFKEIEAKYGEEVAVYAGIARDPDAPELTKEDFAQMRPAVEVVPDLVAYSLRRRGKQKAPTKELVSIRLDSDIANHFRSSGPGWQARLNDTLRQAVFGS